MEDDTGAVFFNDAGFSNDVMHDSIAEGYMEGPNYIFPMVATKVGVMNGGYKSFEALEKGASTLDGADLRFLHPPGIRPFVSKVIGKVRSPKLGTDGKVRAEGVVNSTEWPDMVEKLKSGFFNDVSAAGKHMRDILPEPKKYDGRTALFHETGLEFDHVAILPDGAGACNREDHGCGSFLNDATTSEIDSTSVMTDTTTEEGDNKTGVSMTDEPTTQEPATETKPEPDCKKEFENALAKAREEMKTEFDNMVTAIKAEVKAVREQPTEPQTPAPAVPGAPEGATFANQAAAPAKPAEEPEGVATSNPAIVEKHGKDSRITTAFENMLKYGSDVTKWPKEK